MPSSTDAERDIIRLDEVRDAISGLKLKGAVWLEGDFETSDTATELLVVIENYRDHDKLMRALRCFRPHLKVRAKEHTDNPDVYGRWWWWFRTPARIERLGVVRLPSGVSNQAWPAAWIRRSEKGALDAADLSPRSTW